MHLARELAGKGVRGWRIISELRDEISRHLRLNSSAETLPDADNRVDTRPSTSATAPAFRGRASISASTTIPRRGLAHALSYTAADLRRRWARPSVKSNTPYLSSAIICGTTRMGTDPRPRSSTRTLRSHDHPNLFIVGTSTHVTAPVNAPTLTVAANALRVADRILADLGRR